MNKTKIDWADYSINPVTGKCPRGCFYCYSNRMYDRFGWNPKVEFHPERLEEIKKIKKPSRIFMGSTHDIFGDWIPKGWITQICYYISLYRKHTFLFLTKNPLRYSQFYFAHNQWAGVTHTGEPTRGCFTNGKYYSEIVIGWEHQANCFLSCEPLLGNSVEIPLGCKWLIIGAMTGYGRKYQPKKEWIEDLVYRANRRNIPIFMKNNLAEAWKPNKLIQEFPSF